MATFGLPVQLNDASSFGEVPLALCIVLACAFGTVVVVSTIISVQRWHVVKVHWSEVWRSLLRKPDPAVRADKKRRLKDFLQLLLDIIIVGMMPSVSILCVVMCLIKFFPDFAMYMLLHATLLFVSFAACIMKLKDLGPEAFYWTISVVFMLLGLLPGLATTLENYHFAVEFARLNHILYSVAGLPPLPWILMNLINVAWQLWLVSTLPLSSHAVAHNVYLALLAFGLNVILNLAISLTFGIVAASELKAWDAAKSEGAVRSILKLICDALMVLNDDLTLRFDAPDLAALLLGQAAAKAQAGHRFADFLIDADKERFEEFVSQATNDEAHQIQLHLLDASRQTVVARLYHICLQDPLTSILSHWVGVMEENTESKSLPLQRQPLLTPPPSSPARSGHTLTLSDYMSESDSESEQSGDEGSPRTTPRSTRRQPRTRAGVCVDNWGVPNEPATVTFRSMLDWELVDESQSSRMLFNFSQDASPCGFLSRLEFPEHFLRWFEFCHVFASSGKEPPVKTFEKALVQSVDSQLSYKAKITANVEMQPAPLPVLGRADREAASAVPFDPKSRLVQIRLDLTPPKKVRRDRHVDVPHRRRQRRVADEEQSLAGDMSDFEEPPAAGHQRQASGRGRQSL